MVCSLLSVSGVEVRRGRGCKKRGKLDLISETDATEARRRGDVRGFNGVVDLGSTWFRWDLTFKVSAGWAQALALSRFVWAQAGAKTSQSDLDALSSRRRQWAREAQRRR